MESAIKIFVSRIIGILKLLFFYYFYHRRIEESHRKRKGKCKICGKCCRDIFGIKILRCPFLKGNNCRIHKKRKFIPILGPICSNTPLDFYKTRSSIKDCGYYWEDELF